MQYDRSHRHRPPHHRQLLDDVRTLRESNLLNMTPKTTQESEIYEQMLAMLADQFYHQTGDNITINRMEFAEMLAKQTMHGIELGHTT